jgi:hypothetical protein
LIVATSMVSKVNVNVVAPAGGNLRRIARTIPNRRG